MSKRVRVGDLATERRAEGWRAAKEAERTSALRDEVARLCASTEHGALARLDTIWRFVLPWVPGFVPGETPSSKADLCRSIADALGAERTEVADNEASRILLDSVTQMPIVHPVAVVTDQRDALVYESESVRRWMEENGMTTDMVTRAPIRGVVRVPALSQLMEILNGGPPSTPAPPLPVRPPDAAVVERLVDSETDEEDAWGSDQEEAETDREGAETDQEEAETDQEEAEGSSRAIGLVHWDELSAACHAADMGEIRRLVPIAFSHPADMDPATIDMIPLAILADNWTRIWRHIDLGTVRFTTAARCTMMPASAYSWSVQDFIDAWRDDLMVLHPLARRAILGYDLDAAVVPASTDVFYMLAEGLPVELAAPVSLAFEDVENAGRAYTLYMRVANLPALVPDTATLRRLMEIWPAEDDDLLSRTVSHLLQWNTMRAAVDGAPAAAFTAEQWELLRVPADPQI